jgi:hypothetical protein
MFESLGRRINEDWPLNSKFFLSPFLDLDLVNIEKKPLVISSHIRHLSHIRVKQCQFFTLKMSISSTCLRTTFMGTNFLVLKLYFTNKTTPNFTSTLN